MESIVNQVIQTNKLARECRFSDCKIRANFFDQNTPKEVYCKLHSKPGMITNQAKCKAIDCIKQPSYSAENGDKYCKLHKPENATDTQHKLCGFKSNEGQYSCKKRGSFGKVNEQDIYCKQHKSDDMVDITNPRCIQENCMIRVNKLNSKCKQHRIAIIPIVEESKVIEPIIPKKQLKYCQFEDCKKRPSFGLRDQQDKVMFCADHKSDLMVDVIHPRCQQNNCQSRASFNYIEETRPLYCDLHKYPEMVNIIHIHETCIHEKCKVRATFGLQSNRKRLYCVTHKLSDMVSLDGSMCQYQDCILRASFNMPSNKQAIFCYKHKSREMVNIRDNKCTKCDIVARYDGLCSRCYYQEFPDNQQTRQFKTKERSVVSYMQLNVNEQVKSKMTIDKQIQNGNSKYRPDILFELETHSIIVEIQEFGHRSYDIQKEQQRLMQIYKDLKERPLVIIEFNPDGYYKGEIRIQSPWIYIDKNNLKIQDEQEWKTRLLALMDRVQYWFINIPKDITRETMYMDVFN